MVMNSIDIQPPYARKKRVFVAKHKDRPNSNYIQKRDFIFKKGILIVKGL